MSPFKTVVAILKQLMDPSPEIYWYMKKFIIYITRPFGKVGQASQADLERAKEIVI